jgi:hypothetical protein
MWQVLESYNSKHRGKATQPYTKCAIIFTLVGADLDKSLLGIEIEIEIGIELN